MSRFCFCDCYCNCLPQVKNTDFRGPKSVPPDGKSLACAIICDFRGKSVPTAVRLATGTFATEDRGDFRLRFWCFEVTIRSRVPAAVVQAAAGECHSVLLLANGSIMAMGRTSEREELGP